VEIHANIKLLVKTWYDDEGTACLKAEERLIDTTVGRVIFNRILPPEIQFVNWTLDKGGLKDLVAELYEVAVKKPPPMWPTHQGYRLHLCHPLRLHHCGFRHHRPA
jgi:hypothetical protein